MSRLLYLKKGDEPPAPFELLEYAEPDGGRLHGPTTLAELRLATLEMKVPGTDVYVRVAFHTGTELSIRRFTANSEDTPLAVRGKGVAGAAGAAGVAGAAGATGTGDAGPGPSSTGSALLQALRAPVLDPNIDCDTRSTNKRPYPELVVVPWPLKDLQDVVPAYVAQQLQGAVDQSDPRMQFTEDVRQAPLTSEGMINSWWELDVGKGVEVALRRCGCPVRLTLNARSLKALGLPDFQWWYDEAVSTYGYDFMGGKGKAPSVLHNFGRLDLHIEATNVLCVLQQTCSYAKAKNWSYTWVSTGLELYGIKKVKNDVYAVSPAIRNSSSNPSQREMLFYMVHKAWMESKDGLEARYRARCQVPAGTAGSSMAASAAAVAAAGTGGGSSQQPAAVHGIQQSLAQHTTIASLAVPGGALLLTSTVLGSGESGDVLLGWYCGLEAAVKLAEPSKELLLVEQLQHEAAVMEHLKPLHGDCVPPLFHAEFSHRDGLVYLAMARVSGLHPSRTLRDAMPHAQEALARIHALGVLHGDVREENILLDMKDSKDAQKQCQVWFIDFGQSRLNPTEEECQQEMAQLLMLFRSTQDSVGSSVTTVSMS